MSAQPHQQPHQRGQSGSRSPDETQRRATTISPPPGNHDPESRSSRGSGRGRGGSRGGRSVISEITDTLTKAKEAGVKKSKPKPQPQRKKIPTPLYSLRGGVVSKEASPRDPNINYRLPSAIYKPEAWSTVKPPGKVLAGDTNANPGHDATTSAGPRRRTPSPPRPSRSSCATQPGYRDDDVTNQRKPNQS